MRFAILLLLLVVACVTQDKAAYTPSTDYPCGTLGVVCIGSSGKVNGCCPQYFTCGGGFPSVGCPASACCDLGSGESALGASREREVVPQTTPDMERPK